MKIRKARTSDLPGIRRLAESLGLDYPGLENDRFRVAEDGEVIAGIVALKYRADCEELVALGVDPRYRKKGLGRKLVRVLLDETPTDVFLATTIPEFFERCGFVRASAAPAGMAKDPSWCEGCRKDRCVIMVKTSA
ncbi:MAG: GNAT family N-acetyltransferase [Candidatus Aminicenantes bacterium]|nr:GNAT family N-acetyltransferase [Candidatus Aminicenantes bacterium]